MQKIVLSALVAAGLLASPVAANAMTFAQGIDWDGVVNAGFDGDGSPTGPNPGSNRVDPDNALGAPDNLFLSLGLGGTAVFDFGTAFQGTAQVFEVTFGCTLAGGICTSHPEQVEVFVGNSYTLDSFDLSGFVSKGLVTNGNAQGGGSVIVDGPFSFLALVDRSSLLGPISTDGFDVDAVSVAAVPLPAALPLFGAALGLFGLFGWRRRRTAA